MIARRRFLASTLLLSLPWLRPSWAEDSIERISGLSDAFGNQASFWRVHFSNQDYPVLKLKSADRAGEADFVLDAIALAEFESRIHQVRGMPYTLKRDGVQVVWAHTHGDATLRTLLFRLNGFKGRLLQVEQNKAGQPKMEHQIVLDQSYRELTSAWKKFRRNP